MPGSILMPWITGTKTCRFLFTWTVTLNFVFNRDLKLKRLRNTALNHEQIWRTMWILGQNRLRLTFFLQIRGLNLVFFCILPWAFYVTWSKFGTAFEAWFTEVKCFFLKILPDTVFSSFFNDYHIYFLYKNWRSTIKFLSFKSITFYTF